MNDVQLGILLVINFQRDFIGSLAKQKCKCKTCQGNGFRQAQFSEEQLNARGDNKPIPNIECWNCSGTGIDKKETEFIQELCHECAQLIEGSRLWAMEQIKESKPEHIQNDLIGSGQTISLRPNEKVID